MKKKEVLWTISLIAFDLLSKSLLESLLKNGTIIVIPNFFKLTLAYNAGAAWSILSGNVWFLILISMALLGALFFLYPKIKPSKGKSLSYSLLVSGTIGNLFDRICYGHVRDFFSFQCGTYFFPIFNFADIFIVIGACILAAILGKEDQNARMDK